MTSFFRFDIQRQQLCVEILNLRKAYPDSFAEAWCEARHAVRVGMPDKGVSHLEMACRKLYEWKQACQRVGKAA